MNLTEVTTDSFCACTVVGDMDGDGWDDLAIHGGSKDGYFTNAIAVYSGDHGRWPDGPIGVPDGAMGEWEEVVGGDQFSDQLAAGDIDGDGLSDIVAHAPYDTGADNGGHEGWLFVIPGRTGGFPSGDSVIDDPDVWVYYHDHDIPERTPLDEGC